MGQSSTPTRVTFPYWACEAKDKPGRFKPMIDAEGMRKRSLFGIPLKSSFTNEEVTDEQIQSYIDEAISEIEHQLDITITPEEYCDRYDYNRELWHQSYAYIKLRHPNVLRVTAFQLTFTNGETEATYTDPNGNTVYTDGSPTETDPGEQFGKANNVIVDIPKEFLHVNPQEGTVQLVPAFGRNLSGFIVSALTGTQYWALANSLGNFPGAVRIKYEAGFEEGRIPAMIVGLVETVAAYRLLSVLGPILFPHNSVGISIDGVSQSTSTPGPAFLNQRLNELEKIKEQLMDTARGYYQRKFLVDFV